MTDFLGKTVHRIKPFQLKLSPDQKTFSTFGTRPVFLISFTDGSQVVLKAEMADTQRPLTAQKSSVFIAGLHSGMSSDLGVSGVSRGELANLALAPLGTYDHSVPQIAQNYLYGLIVEAGKMFEWYTMNYFTALKSLEDQVEKNKDQQNMAKVGAYKLALKLKSDKAMLAQLGMIVAVDLFSGNEDRFNASGHIVNKGNIVFQKNADKTYSPLGVDFFDAQKEAANLYKQVSDATRWSGMVLVDPQKIRAFATQAIGELNQMFSAAITPIGMPPEGVLGMTEINAFADAIQAGADSLRKSLQKTTRLGGKLPGGVTQRMELLGWQWQASNWTSGTKPNQSPVHNIKPLGSQAMPMPSTGYMPTPTPFNTPNPSPNTSPNTSPLRQRSGQGKPLPLPNWRG